MSNEEYISKEEAVKKGYRRRREGGLYKLSVLEKYYEKGWLELKNSRFSAEDRKKAGEQLLKDFYLGNYNNLRSVSLIKTNSNYSSREDALFYQERYIKAMKSVPAEFWQVVRIVCIEDKELKADNNILSQSLLAKQMVYHLKCLLVLGLERLVKFYFQKNKKSS